MNDSAARSHLKGREAIMETFGVSKETVAQWRKEGAPIFVVGRKLQTDYWRLWTWIVHRETGETQTP